MVAWVGGKWVGGWTVKLKKKVYSRPTTKKRKEGFIFAHVVIRSRVN